MVGKIGDIISWRYPQWNVYRIVRLVQISGQFVARFHHATGPNFSMAIKFKEDHKMVGKIGDIISWQVSVERPSNQKSLKIFRKAFVALNNKFPVFPKETEIHEQAASKRSAGVRLDQSMVVRVLQIQSWSRLPSIGTAHNQLSVIRDSSGNTSVSVSD